MEKNMGAIIMEGLLTEHAMKTRYVVWGLNEGVLILSLFYKDPLLHSLLPRGKKV